MTDLPQRIERPEVEIEESFANGVITIEHEFDEKPNRTLEYVNVLGVRIRRRDPKFQKLPGSEQKKENFSDLTFESSDIDILKAALMRYAIGHHSLFLSPPGLGKSTLMEFLAFLLNVPFYRVQCEKGMNVQQQFLWTYVRDNGSWKGRLGPLPESMQHGAILLVDELPNLEPPERQVVLGPTERPNNPRIFKRAPILNIPDFPGDSKQITAAPGWFVVATGNYSEGQGVDEIHVGTEREERRIRPHFLNALPLGTSAKRIAGRHRKTPRLQSNMSLPRERFYPEGLLEIPDEIIDTVADFFEQVREFVKTEVLSTARQEQKTFLNEAIDRCFDHFMYFQIQLHETHSTKGRLEELLESAYKALEFYLVNAFRDSTKMNVPSEVTLPGGIPDLKKDAQGRIFVRPYLKWRLRTLLDVKLWKTEKEMTVSLRQRLAELLGVKGTQVEDPAVTAVLDEIGSILESIPPPASPIPPPSSPETTAGSPPSAEVKKMTLTETPDNFNELTVEKKLEIWRKQYTESLQVSAAFRHFDLNNPEITTTTEKKVKAPPWEKVKAAISKPEVIEKVKLLKNPILLIVPSGQSFEQTMDEVSQSKAEKEEDKKTPRFPYWTSWNDKKPKTQEKNNGIGGDKTGEVVSFNPDDPSKGETKAQRYGESGWEVLIVDGCDEVPKETKNKKAIDLAKDLVKQGLSLMGKEAYIHLQERGACRGTQYDLTIWTWLDEYIKSFSAVAFARWNPAGRRLYLAGYDPSRSDGDLGGRRSVRVKI